VIRGSRVSNSIGTVEVDRFFQQRLALFAGVPKVTDNIDDLIGQ
jgi:hypothetical protein